MKLIIHSAYVKDGNTNLKHKESRLKYSGRGVQKAKQRETFLL